MNNRVYQYQNIDGLGELGFGMMLLLLGLAASLAILFPDAYLPQVVLLGVAFPFVSRSMVELKKRLTYPRTGYAMPRFPRYLSFVFLGSLLLINTLDVFVWKSDFMLALLQPFSFGLIFTCLLLWLGGGLVRFYYLAAAAFLLGAGLTWYGTDVYLGMVFYGTVLGLLLVVSGGVTLRRYLKEHPRP